ncbi:MAG: sugar-transfer associated ATP-grasp domain-containing protein [Acidobacteriota bacterium]|nr:sugar-transfer associated ATP-grasp domain-containing protein [Acidobacteriota bacterium]
MIYKRIIFNKKLPIKQRILKAFLYFILRRKARISWWMRFKKVFFFNPEYIKPIDKAAEKTHKSYWSFFSKDINLQTIRVCAHISGASNAEMVPEEIYVSDIEPSLNTEKGIEYISNKSFYNLWYPGSLFPKSYFHNIAGEYYDNCLNIVTYEDILNIVNELSYPVVLKPNKDSYGGQDIYFLKNKYELIEKILNRKNYVVQEKLEQHPFFAKYNPNGLNTIRVYLYKSVKNEKYRVINTALRMGKGGSLDNETAGGIICLIKPNGQLNGYAVDKYGTKYEKHPDTGYRFDEIVPEYSKLTQESISISQKVFYSRILGLDAYYDRESRWRFIEINTRGHTIRFSQYGGQPFFKEYSSEILEYCKINHWALQ